MIPTAGRDQDRDRDREGNRTGDRAQLMLVGAVAIAIVFLGLVVVFNTVLFTASSSPTEPLESAEEARAFDQQVRNDTRMILHEVSRDSGESECTLFSDFCDYARENLTEYALMMSTSRANTGPVYASIRVVDVDGTLNNLGACSSVPDASLKLCAELEVVYVTNEFEYRNTMVVAVED